MEKINVVLVVLKQESLENVVKNLNFEKINLVAIIVNNNEEKNFTLGEEKIPLFSFVQIKSRVKKYKNYIWLVSGYLNDIGDLGRMKKFLTVSGVSEDNIVNLEIPTLSSTWLSNLRHIEEHGADFFATGNEYMRDNLNLKYIPCVHEDKNLSRGGVNLSNVNQTLWQSYLTARYVFEHVKHGTIKFVLIGLSPDSFHCDKEEDFFDFKSLLSIETATAENTDLNFDNVKENLNNNFSAEAIANWKDETKPFKNEIVEKNVQILKDYIKLCLDNGAQPVGVVFPFTSAARKIYNEEILTNFHETIHQLEENYNFSCVDMFDLNLDFDCFCDMTHLNLSGIKLVNILLSLKLYMKNLIPVESFCEKSYLYFYYLSSVALKDEYNALMEQVFETSLNVIRHKEKIKIGFLVSSIAEWCGDYLYNLFANNERFETTVFCCHRGNELLRKDFFRGVEQLKSHGLNVVVLAEATDVVPNQDVIITLTPYLYHLPKVFRPKNISVKTLMVHMPYAFGVGRRSSKYYNSLIFRTAWKMFFSSTIEFQVYDEKTTVGMPRGAYSGYPRMDVFFDKNIDFHFEWKMAQPDAKKIIWAPHWSISSINKQATFQWKYQFMYEFAKAHPEISWVVKPHPQLLASAVEEKVFPSAEAFEEYLQQWNDLPNAQVYTGAYYQSIFATSDGMILDSCSFIAEYQFTHNPMIFLTRKGEGFNRLGDEILKVSYLVSGKKLKNIAALMQKVFIEGDDYKAAERKEVFDKYLNYPEFNGMLASEFIYKSIADELKGEST